MSKQAKKKKPKKKYRPIPDGPPYKIKDLHETGAMGKNTSYGGVKSDEIDHYTVGGVTFICRKWAHRVLGWPL